MKQLSKMIFILISTMLLFTPLLANAEYTSQIGRYLTVENMPKRSQIDLLSQNIQVRFPQNIQTIGEALNYLLKFSGYSLVVGTEINSAFKTTLTKPLPIINRELGPISLKDGLLTLMGSAFYLVDDPINRIVDFRLKPAYIQTKSIKRIHSHEVKHENNFA